MATQQELDDAVVAAAQQLNGTLNNLAAEEQQRVQWKQAKQDADANLTIHQQAVKDLRSAIKQQAGALNNAIQAANAGPTP